MSDTLTVRNVARRAESTSTGVMLAHGEEATAPDDEHTRAMLEAGHFIEIPADTPPPKVDEEPDGKRAAKPTRGAAS